MWDFSVARSFAVLGRTGPFVLLRLAVFFGITFAYVFAAGTGAGFAYGLGRAFAADPEAAALLGALFGVAVVSVALYWLREYVLYLVKAAHVAVMVAFLDGRRIPPDQSQLAYGRGAVEARFAETNLLFVFDQLIKGVIATVSRLVWSVAGMVPLPGLRGLVSLLRAVLRAALGYVDEIILARDIRIGSDNPWATAQDGLVLYAQNHRVLLKNAVWLALMMYGLALVIFLLVLGPAIAFVWIFPGAWAGFGVGLAVLLAWSIKAAILEPFAIASLMQVYFAATEGQTPDPVWRARLEEVSAKFRALGERADAGREPPPAEAARKAG
jgi:hypothetical protein